jgi:6-phosphogluconolactonase
MKAGRGGGRKGRLLAILAGLALWSPAATAGAAPRPPADPVPCTGQLVYLGSVAEAPAGGVYAARFDEKAGRLCSLGRSAQVALPTWMTMHPTLPVLYVTNEAAGAGDPGVLAYTVDRATGALAPRGAASSAGAGPTYLSIAARSRTLFAAHWNSGHVSAMPMSRDGTVGPPVSVRQEAGGERPQRRTHQVELDPSGRFVLATEFGLDRLLIYRFDPAARTLTPAEPPSIQLPPRSGPRHFVFHPNGRLFYLLDQRSSEVRLYRWKAAAGALTLEQTVPTTLPAFQATNQAAGIVITPDGRNLYVSNRGEDVLVVYAVAASTGRLREVQRIASDGKTPRDFSLSPNGRWVLVANQDSGAVTIFARDRRSGRLTSTGRTMTMPKPVVVVFADARRPASARRGGR